MDWIHRISDIVARDGAAARAVIVEIDTPTPRALGASMIITTDACEGKIGRAALQSAAIAEARRLMGEARAGPGGPRWLRSMLRFPTGTVLGETSGGTQALLIEAFTPAECAALATLRRDDLGGQILARPLASGTAPIVIADAQPPARPPLQTATVALGHDPRLAAPPTDAEAKRSWLLERLAAPVPRFHVYGTGLVARALVPLLAGLPLEVVWLDSEPANFPAEVPPNVRAIATDDLAAAARQSPSAAGHAVMTVTHDLDLAVCRAVLETAAPAYLGVIGSQLKRQRLVARLTEAGIAPAALARIDCPIGLAGIHSKTPAVIAVSIAAQALIALQPD